MTYNTKPFDINQARAGAPVGCETERNKIEIFKYTDHSIFGSIRYGDEEEVVTSWYINGKNDPCLKSDLVMLPLGYCEGKPVFVGDELDWGQGATPTSTNDIGIDFDKTGCKWPKPEPKYPETRMQDYELGLAFKHTMTDEQAQVVRNGANAVIARALSDGDVFTKQQVTAVLEELRNICLRHANPLNIRDIVDGTDWDAILKAWM